MTIACYDQDKRIIIKYNGLIFVGTAEK